MASGVAIVGISVELPSGNYSEENLDHNSFFEFLLNYGESYERLPRDRFNVEAWRGNGIGQIHVDGGTFLKEIDSFDNIEFGVSSRDARAMAPVTKKLLENCFLALLDSGIDYRARNVGCYTAGNSFELSNITEPDEYEPQGSFAGYAAMVANRVSNHLDLLGPSLPTDTACSSTLVALHLAVQAVLNGDCEAAVVGGCQLNHRLMDWITYSQGSLLAKDGKCKPFDASADGFARAEGCVAVVLKTLEDALRDNDYIYATILGTAINNGGAGAPPGAPVADAQRDAMLQAFRRAGRCPKDVDYIELHATGTAKGDPTEANWVGKEFQREDEVLIGSVKGNIGHTEITAFLASLSKVLSILQRGTIPPNVNLTDPNPEIKWAEYRLKVPTSPMLLPRHSPNTHLVSMAGSGIGGSNGHVVLEGPPLRAPVGAQQHLKARRPVLLLAGGLTPRSAAAVAESIIACIEGGEVDVSAMSTILGRRARQMTWRSYVVSGGDTSNSISFGEPQHCPRNANPLVFVFSGQGPQHINMGRELFKTFPVFRNSVLNMDNTYKTATGKSIIDDWGLFGGNCSTALPDVWPISLTLPAIAIFQIALFDLLVHLGINPDIVIGHSAGETAVLYASGAAPKAMTVELAVLRGVIFTQLEHQGGTMAALSCTAHEAMQILDQACAQEPGCAVEIACYNAPAAVAIAGHMRAVDRVVELAQARGIYIRKLPTRVPIHSSLMDACREEYCGGLYELFARYPGAHVPKILTYSTLTGGPFGGPFDADYFWQNTRGEVRFTETVEAIASYGSHTFVEISPRPALASYVRSMAQEPNIVLTTVRRQRSGQDPSEYRDVLELCGQLTITGHNCVDFTVLNGRACYEVQVPLPSYPFSKKRFPLYPDTAGYRKQLEPRRGPLNHRHLRVNKESHPSLGEHVIRGEPIMPAAGFIEMALEFGARTLINVNLQSILSLSAERPVSLQVRLQGSFWTVSSTVPTSKISSNIDSDHIERLHADGFLSFEAVPTYPDLDVSGLRKHLQNNVGSDFYPSLSYYSSYGPRMRRVTNVYFGRNEALASICGMDDILSEDAAYFLHPAILDACIQVSAYKPFHGNFDPNVYYLPAHVDAVFVHEPLKTSYFPAHLYAHVELRAWHPDHMRYDVSLVNDFGKRLCTVKGLRMTKHHINPLASVSGPLELVLQPISILSLPTTSGRISTAHQNTQLFEISDEIELHHQYRTNGVHDCSDVQYWCHSRDIQALNLESQSGLSSHEDTTGSVIEGVLHTILSHISDQSHIRVIRVLISRLHPIMLESFAQVLKGFPAVFFEIYISSDDTSATLLVEDFSGIVRTAATDIQRSFFEMIFTSPNDFPEAVIQSFGSMLVPGGVIVFAEGLPKPLGHRYLSLDTVRHVSSTPTLPLETLEKLGFSVVQPHGPDCAIAQNCTADALQATEPLYDPLEAFVFQYELRNEVELQWEFSGLNIRQELDVWILASEGKDGGSAVGMVRALRREYSSWTIRLVVFPLSYPEEMRLQCLRRLPTYMKEELDILVSRTGDFTVFRLAPVGRPPHDHNPARWNDTTSDIPHGHVLVHVLYSSSHYDISALVASVDNANNTGIREGSILLAMITGTPGTSLVLDVTITCSVPPSLLEQVSMVVQMMAPLVTAVLAPGLAAFRSPARLRTLRILLTHADIPFGRIIKSIYAEKATLTEVVENITLFDLASLESQPFDLIISGYDDHAHSQVLRSILRPGRGRLFLWGNRQGLRELIDRELYTVVDAMNCVLQSLDEQPRIICENTSITPSLAPSDVIVTQVSPQAISTGVTFSADKTYLLVGGIGSIGARLALYLYERGARHIVVSSRTGARGLRTSNNLMVYRIFEYLKGISDLDIRLVAVDASSRHEMKTLRDNINPKIAGCIILTAVLSDRVFQYLEEEQFTAVFAAKIGVLDALIDTIDVSSLEFLVAFSSVSGLFGVGGQSNYGAANSTLEETMSVISNGFCFVCPGILDSSLMLANGMDTEKHRLAHFIEWSITTDEMVLWFDDAMTRYQGGQKFSRYIPNLNWEVMDRTHGMNKLGAHLVPTRTAKAPTTEDDTGRVAEIVRSTLNISSDDFSAEVPFTAYGLDSLSASRLSFMLRPMMSVTQIQLLADMTLRDLQTRLSAEPVSEDFRALEPTTGKNEIQAMRDMLSKYTQDLREQRATTDIRATRNDVVLLTGSTGALGANILAQLLDNSDVTKVFALNRKGTDRHCLIERQVAALVTQGLPPTLAESQKLVLIEGDLLLDGLGIPLEVFSEMLSSVTHVIHNAWTIDFLSSLEAMEDLVRGTRRLLDIAALSTRATPPSFSFISSIGIYQHYSGSAPAPEEPVLDAKMAVQTGYMESKWVAERIVQIAGARLGLKAHVIRVGLLTGGVNGSWDPTHWLPALVQSATYVGCLPESDSLVSWIPVDVAAAAVVDLRHASDDTLHVIHPRPMLWSDIMVPIASLLDVPLVPYIEWFCRLENMANAISHAPSQRDSRRLRHALRLIDFYRLGMRGSKGVSGSTESMGLLPQVKCQKAMRSSATLQNPELCQLGISDIERWVSYWRQAGHLPNNDSPN